MSKANNTWPVPEDVEMINHVSDVAAANDLLSDDSEDNSDSSMSVHDSQPSNCWQSELSTLLLPSTLGINVCRELGYETTVHKEKMLRMGQANDALHGLRVALCHKAILFRGLREATSKKKRNRSWDQIKSTTGSARHHVRVYLRARTALMNLGATEAELEPYQPLTREQLRITTARIDPALRGTRNSSLAWFWVTDVKRDMQDTEHMDECKCQKNWKEQVQILTIQAVYRVHWLKAKARCDQWEEEITLLLEEMNWTPRFFRHMVGQWSKQVREITPSEIPENSAAAESSEMDIIGKNCYALKARKVWLDLAEVAEEMFQKEKQSLGFQIQ